jgi:hypothetical protein
MWRALEPVHAVTYFAPESRDASAALGLRGFWRGYFAQRAAPLGAAPPELVTALFFTFHPAFVARSVPEVWSAAGPDVLVRVRRDAVDAALRRLLSDEVVAGPAVAEAAEIARAAALAAPLAGRGMAAANAALDWPDAPHLVLWHAQTVLRESRGDGHVAALVVAGLDPVESLVLFGADLGLDGLRERRGWSEEEWTDALARLAGRGLLDGGSLTPEGRALRAEVEARTDALADVSWQAVGDARAERLTELAAPLVTAIVAGGAFMDDNPMGLRPLVSAR